MRVFVCVDDACGVMFNRRRQSMDRVLREYVTSACAGPKLYMSLYSAGQFSDTDREAVTIIADDDFLTKAESGDYCFIEDKIGQLRLDAVDMLYLVRWNRRYPADTFFRTDPKGAGFRLEKVEEFAGSSHEKITVEVYRK